MISKHTKPMVASTLTFNSSSDEDTEIAVVMSSKSACYFCGRSNCSDRKKCKTKSSKCFRCQKIGHWESACKTKRADGLKRKHSYKKNGRSQQFSAALREKGFWGIWEWTNVVWRCCNVGMQGMRYEKWTVLLWNLALRKIVFHARKGRTMPQLCYCKLFYYWY